MVHADSEMYFVLFEREGPPSESYPRLIYKSPLRCNYRPPSKVSPQPLRLSATRPRTNGRSSPATGI